MPGQKTSLRYIQSDYEQETFLKKGSFGRIYKVKYAKYNTDEADPNITRYCDDNGYMLIKKPHKSKNQLSAEEARNLNREFQICYDMDQGCDFDNGFMAVRPISCGLDASTGKELHLDLEELLIQYQNGTLARSMPAMYRFIDKNPEIFLAKAINALKDAQHFVHVNGYSHLDSAPRNIMLGNPVYDSHGEVIDIKFECIDWGMAAKHDERVYRENCPIGITSMKSIAETKHDKYSDVYALKMLVLNTIPKLAGNGKKPNSVPDLYHFQGPLDEYFYRVQQHPDDKSVLEAYIKKVDGHLQSRINSADTESATKQKCHQLQQLLTHYRAFISNVDADDTPEYSTLHNANMQFAKNWLQQAGLNESTLPTVSKLAVHNHFPDFLANLQRIKSISDEETKHEIDRIITHYQPYEVDINNKYIKTWINTHDLKNQSSFRHPKDMQECQKLIDQLTHLATLKLEENQQSTIEDALRFYTQQEQELYADMISRECRTFYTSSELDEFIPATLANSQYYFDSIRKFENYLNENIDEATRVRLIAVLSDLKKNQQDIYTHEFQSRLTKMQASCQEISMLKSHIHVLKYFAEKPIGEQNKALLDERLASYQDQLRQLNSQSARDYLINVLGYQGSTQALQIEAMQSRQLIQEVLPKLNSFKENEIDDDMKQKLEQAIDQVTSRCQLRALNKITQILMDVKPVAMQLDAPYFTATDELLTPAKHDELSALFKSFNSYSTDHETSVKIENLVYFYNDKYISHQLEQQNILSQGIPSPDRLALTSAKDYRPIIKNIQNYLNLPINNDTKSMLLNTLDAYRGYQQDLKHQEVMQFLNSNQLIAAGKPISTSNKLTVEEHDAFIKQIDKEIQDSGLGYQTKVILFEFRQALISDKNQRLWNDTATRLAQLNIPDPVTLEVMLAIANDSNTCENLTSEVNELISHAQKYAGDERVRNRLYTIKELLEQSSQVLSANKYISDNKIFGPKGRLFDPKKSTLRPIDYRIQMLKLEDYSKSVQLSSLQDKLTKAHLAYTNCQPDYTKNYIKHLQTQLPRHLAPEYDTALAYCEDCMYLLDYYNPDSSSKAALSDLVNDSLMMLIKSASLETNTNYSQLDYIQKMFIEFEEHNIELQQPSHELESLKRQVFNAKFVKLSEPKFKTRNLNQLEQQIKQLLDEVDEFNSDLMHPDDKQTLDAHTSYLKNEYANRALKLIRRQYQSDQDANKAYNSIKDLAVGEHDLSNELQDTFLEFKKKINQPRLTQLLNDFFTQGKELDGLQDELNDLLLKYIHEINDETMTLFIQKILELESEDYHRRLNLKDETSGKLTHLQTHLQATYEYLNTKIKLKPNCKSIISTEFSRYVAQHFNEIVPTSPPQDPTQFEAYQQEVELCINQLKAMNQQQSEPFPGCEDLIAQYQSALSLVHQSQALPKQVADMLNQCDRIQNSLYATCRKLHKLEHLLQQAEKLQTQASSPELSAQFDELNTAINQAKDACLIQLKVKNHHIETDPHPHSKKIQRQQTRLNEAKQILRKDKPRLAQVTALEKALAAKITGQHAKHVENHYHQHKRAHSDPNDGTKYHASSRKSFRK